MKGHTYKRCPCGVLKDAKGRRINCQKRHGTWYFAHELPPLPNGKRRQIFKGGFATEREAREALGQAVARAAGGGYVEPTKLTVREYLQRWLDGKGKLRASTRRSYAAHVDLYLSPGLGYLRLADLRDVHVERLYAVLPLVGRTSTDDEMPEELRRILSVRKPGQHIRPLGDATIHRIHATLMSALNNAVKRKLIPANPASFVEVPTGRRPKAVVWTPARIEAWKRTGVRPAVAVWTAEDAGAFLDSISDHRLYPLFHLVAYRGLRRGEAVGVRWEDLDLEAGSLTVTQQVVQLGWATEIGEPKTDSGARTIALDAVTVTVLRRWLKRQQGEAAAPGWTDSGHVFTREDGAPLHPAQVTSTFQELYTAAGLPPIRLHDLRHTAASLALQAGVPLKVVSELLGHSSLAITADTYTSVLPVVAHAAAQAVADTIPRTKRHEEGDDDMASTAMAEDGALAAPDAAPLAVRWHEGANRTSEAEEIVADDAKAQVNQGGPRGDRTHSPRIKSPLLCRLS